VRDVTRLLIELKTAGNHGLAPRRWVAQLEEIRALPETGKAAR
jgi:hypothetical protein